MRQPQTEAGKRYVGGSLGDMNRAYGYGWSLRTVIADIERQAQAFIPDRLTQAIINLAFQRPTVYDSIEVRDTAERYAARSMAERLLAEYERLGQEV